VVPLEEIEKLLEVTKKVIATAVEKGKKRRYKIEVSVEKGYVVENREKIVEAVRAHWSFDDQHQQATVYDDYSTPTLFLSGNGVGLATAQKHVDAICAAIWGANGAYCELHVWVLCLDELPWEDYSPTKDACQ